jgi:uncharacterized repeat protein (TIGR01451 family)/choice-of-anchor A domain-containing protein
MSWLSCFFGGLGQNVASTKGHAGRRQRFGLALEQLERRDCPSTFLQVVSTPNYPTLGSFDAVSATVAGTQYQYAGIQFGVKVASSASALPGNGVPDFYSFCVDITQSANLTTSYSVSTSDAASTLPNGKAVAFLYDTYNSPVGSPLDKTHAAALQIAIWEAEYGTGIVTPSDVSFMNSYNGTAETTSLLNAAATYLASVPSNPTSDGTVYGLGLGTAPQSLIGPPSPATPQISVVKKADAASIVAGQTAGFTVTITNTGTVSDTGVTLTDALPAGTGNDINWQIDTSGTGFGSGTNPADFQITGSVGSQSLGLSSSFITTLGNSLAPGQSIAVHITGATSASDIGGSTSTTLGAAGNYAVLYEGTGGHNLQITNVTINGNVGVGGTGNVHFSGPGTIGGRLDFSAANTGQYSSSNGSNTGPTSVNYNVAAVTTALNTANNLSSSLAGLGSSLTINGNQTINESAGQLDTVNGVMYRVFNVTSYSENDGLLVTINGDGSGDTVVFNFGSNSNVNLGGDVALTGGLTPDQVLWNFTSSNQHVQLNNNASSYRSLAFQGVILAPNDVISVVNANLNGRVIGGDSSDMQIVSGDTIKVPVVPGKLVNTATVSANNVSAQNASATITVNPAGTLASMDPPTVGYWQSSGGQAVIDSLNGSAKSRALGNWLAKNFANLYGAVTGKNDLAGKTNAQVAAYYDSLAAVDQEVLATALSVYASSSTLSGGTMGKAAGLPVTAAGLGNATVNVGADGAAAGVRDYGTASLLSILEHVNAESKAGLLYGKVSNATVRSMLAGEADDLFDRINEPTPAV